MGEPIREDILRVFRAAVSAADPAGAVERSVSLAGSCLAVEDRSFDLDRFERLIVLGAGKASLQMARALLGILEGRPAEGSISTPGRAQGIGGLEVFRAEHPVPGAGSRAAADRAMEMAGGAGPRDLLFCLISGGASSLWSLPAPGIDLAEMALTTRLLLNCGADIHEINAIRKHVSGIKGGGLARAAHPAALVTLAISDVIGDEPSSIGSGPTVPDPTTFDQALRTVLSYGLDGELPPSVVKRLRKGAEGRVEETPKPGDPLFDGSIAVIAASNRLAVEAAAAEGRRLGYDTRIISTEIRGEARRVGEELVESARHTVCELREIERPAMLIAGGETTVTVRGGGRGGRNQELTLAAAIAMEGGEPMMLASMGTDGIDGNTDAAGAFADEGTVSRARERGMEASAYLDDNDSNTFFGELGDLVRTGPTGTNVMDVQVIVLP